MCWLNQLITNGIARVSSVYLSKPSLENMNSLNSLAVNPLSPGFEAGRI